MNEKPEVIKQIIILVVVLVIVLITAIYVGVKGNKTDEEKEETNKIDMSNVVIDGFTKDTLEDVKVYLDDDKYNNYKDTFNKIENGELNYEEGMSLETEEQEITKEDTKKSEETLKNALDSNKWHYYVREDGTVTNTIVFDDNVVETH